MAINPEKHLTKRIIFFTIVKYNEKKYFTCSTMINDFNAHFPNFVVAQLAQSY